MQFCILFYQSINFMHLMFSEITIKEFCILHLSLVPLCDQMDEFEIEAVTLHKLRKIRIGHDGTGPGAGWFLDKVVVTPLDARDREKQGEMTFICNRWLAEDEDDGLIEREITASGAQLLSSEFLFFFFSEKYSYP